MIRSAASVMSALAGLAGCNSVLGIHEHALATEQPALLGPPGCFRGTPSTDADFFNQCTTSQFIKFDNCARLGLCSNEVWPLIDPVPADPGPDPGAPANPPTVSCYDANLRNRPIFMQGSTNFTPFIQAMAPLVARNGYVIVWQPTSSCAGAGAGGFDTAAGKDLMKNPLNASQPWAAFYGADGAGTPCLLGNSPTAPDASSEVTDIGESDIFAGGCPHPAGQSDWVPGSTDYPLVAHYLGPIQAMVFVTPLASRERVISAEAARVVFGMGGKQGTAAPWIDPTHMFVRSSTTGTNNILSRAIDVPNDKWWGVDTKTAAATQMAILTTSENEANQTIGTLSIDFADRVKNSLHILYFQAKGQLVGFLPDTGPNTADKKNVRDGHYSPWGPIHLYTRRVGAVVSAQAAAFITPFTVPNEALIDATIAGGNVPVCAMHVTRDQEMGPIIATTPTFACDCYYDLKVSGANGCKSCRGSADCPGDRPACNLGFCEVD